MTDHDPDQDNVLKELVAALQVEPSRAFADGVRARVNRSRTTSTRVWLGLAAAASIGLATMALWRPSVDAPAMVSAAPTQASAPAIPSKAPESVAVAPRPTAAPPPVARREATIARPTVTTVASEPRLEVITNQGAVLRALWADYGNRPLVIAEAVPVVDSQATAAIVVNPIEVRPIVVSEIGKEPGPTGATPIIRRADATRETR